MKKLFLLTALLISCTAFPSTAKAQSLDAYGGRTDITCTATGWFHTQKIATRWWLCDPLGNVFFYINVDAVVMPSNAATKYGSIVPKAVEEENLRLKGWGFNGVGFDSYAYSKPIFYTAAFPLDSNGHRANQVQMPFLIQMTPGKYALYNVFSYLSEPVKSMVGVTSPNFVAGGGFLSPNGLPDWYDAKISTEATGELTHLGQANDYINYAVGVEIDDGDQVNGMEEDPAFTTDPAGHTLEHLGFTVATMSPLQAANSSVYSHNTTPQYQYVFTNTQMYSKLALETFLKAEYTTIGALNTAWGASGGYTTWDSSGTCIGSQPITCAASASADSIGTGDGSTLTFSATLSHTVVSKCSLQILVAGVPVAGDDAHGGFGTYCATTGGVLWGPHASGTINVSTGAVSITFTAGNAPANAAAITATYVANGWQIGTGFLDESDNATSQAWMGTDFVALSNAHAQVATDMDAFLKAIAIKMFSTYKTVITATFPNLMYFGPNSLGAWGVPPRAPVLQAASGYLDAFVTSQSGAQFTQSEMNFIKTNYGDKPYFASFYTCVYPDSADSSGNCANNGQTGFFTTEAARGTYYQTQMQNVLTNVTTTAGDHPFIGFEWFAFNDVGGTTGLATTTDNAYDGSEPASGVVTCSGILGTVNTYGGPFNCGSEPMPGGAGVRPFGNAMTAITSANQLWLSGAHYTVKAGGGGSFTTIATCIAAMSPSGGDTCTVFAGTYSETPTLKAGTAGTGTWDQTHANTVTVNPGDIVTAKAFTMASYTTLNGFTITDTSLGEACVSIPAGTTDYTVSNNSLNECGIAASANSGIVELPTFGVGTSSYGHITGNSCLWIAAIPPAPATTGGGGVCIWTNGNYHLIENNDFSHVIDGMRLFGQHQVVRGNVMHDTSDTDWTTPNGENHIDFAENFCNTVPMNSNFVVFESNKELRNIGSNAHEWIAQGGSCTNPASNLISRFNLVAHQGSTAGSGYALLDQSGGYTFVKDYNNTLASIGVNFDLTNDFASSSTNGSQINDIFYYPYSATLNPYVVDSGSATGFIAGSNDAYCTGSCTFYSRVYTSGTFAADAPGNITTNPNFVNASADNYSLSIGSPDIGTGTFLTTTVGVGVTSTALTVADASFFQAETTLPGVQADWIRIGASTTAQISSINYSTNVITLASGVSWSTGASVYLYKNSSGTVVLNGALPDIGAFPFIVPVPALPPAFTPSPGTYSTVQAVSMSNPSSAPGICYTLDGTTPITNGDNFTCSHGSIYVGPVTVGSTETLSAVAGGSGFLDSSVTSGLYTINLTASKLTLAPLPGLFNTPQTVVITNTSAAPLVCYTLNGIAPSIGGSASCVIGAQYSVPLLLSTNVTLFAVAGGPGYLDSAIAGGTYTVTGLPQSGAIMIVGNGQVCFQPMKPMAALN